MTDLDDAVEAARGELVKRLLDDDERERMPAHVLVRVLGALQTEQRHLEVEPVEEDADPLDLVRNLPVERAIEVLARLKGVTTEQAAILIRNEGGLNGIERGAIHAGGAAGRAGQPEPVGEVQSDESDAGEA